MPLLLPHSNLLFNDYRTITFMLMMRITHEYMVYALSNKLLLIHINDSYYNLWYKSAVCYGQSI